MTAEALERQLRRLDEQEGYVIRKSRARSWSLDNQQGYMLVEARRNFVVLGSKYDANLDEIAAHLKD